MEFVSSWWDSMDLALQIFYAIALLSTVTLLGQLILMLFGFGDGGADMDTDFDGDFGGDLDADVPDDMPDHAVGGAGETGLHVLSVRTVVAFLVGFGWTGVVTIKGGWPMAGSVSLAILIGTAFMFGVFYLMTSLHSLRHSGSLNYRNAIGEIGTVYVPIPANMEDFGQVEVLVQGRLVVVNAYTRSSEPISSQTKVRVSELLDQQSLIVERLSEVSS